MDSDNEYEGTSQHSETSCSKQVTNTKASVLISDYKQGGKELTAFQKKICRPVKLKSKLATNHLKVTANPITQLNSIDTDVADSVEQHQGQLIKVNMSDYHKQQRNSIETVETNDAKNGAAFYGNLMNRVNYDSIRVSQSFEPTNLVE